MFSYHYCLMETLNHETIDAESAFCPEEPDCVSDCSPELWAVNSFKAKIPAVTRGKGCDQSPLSILFEQVFSGETVLESEYLENATQAAELSLYAEAYIDLQLSILRFLVEGLQQPANSTGSKARLELDEKAVTHVRKEIENLFLFEAEFATVRLNCCT